uniref:Bcl-2 Bcl-2 homology region 1-3 domain-containing protein n=1 Tax=Monopterus albus TaxID=43700 RepID=A0A3Q3QYY1_MONAL
MWRLQRILLAARICRFRLGFLIWTLYFKGMIATLSSHDGGSVVRSIGLVAGSIFADGTANWGRVASLVAFGATVCRYLKERGGEDCTEQMGEEISAYLLTDQKEWLIKNDSWDGFVTFFANSESTLRRNILVTFVGIGVITLALLIV